MDTDNGVHAQTVISGLGMCKRMMSGLFAYKLLPKLYVTVDAMTQTHVHM